MELTKTDKAQLKEIIKKVSLSCARSGWNKQTSSSIRSMIIMKMHLTDAWK